MKDQTRELEKKIVHGIKASRKTQRNENPIQFPHQEAALAHCGIVRRWGTHVLTYTHTVHVRFHYQQQVGLSQQLTANNTYNEPTCLVISTAKWLAVAVIWLARQLLSQLLTRFDKHRGKTLDTSKQQGLPSFSSGQGQVILRHTALWICALTC